MVNWNSDIFQGSLLTDNGFLITKIAIRTYRVAYKVKSKVHLGQYPISVRGVVNNRYREEQGKQTGILHSTSHNLWLRDFMSQKWSFSSVSEMVLSNVFIWNLSNHLLTWTWHKFWGIFILKARGPLDSSEYIATCETPQAAYLAVLRNMNPYQLPSL